MNDKIKRTKILVLDIVERLDLPCTLYVFQKGKIIYNGSCTRIPDYLLNETVNGIGMNCFNDCLKLYIE